MKSKKTSLIVILFLISTLIFSANTMNWENVENKSDETIKNSLKTKIITLEASSSLNYIQLKQKANREKSDLSTDYRKELSAKDNVYKSKKSSFDDKLSEVNILRTETSDIKTEIQNLEKKVEDNYDIITREKQAIKDIKAQIKNDLKTIPQNVVIMGWVEKKRTDTPKLIRKNISDVFSIEAVKHINKLEVISNIIVENDLSVQDIIQTKVSGECSIEMDDFSITDEGHNPPKNYFISYGLAEVYPLKKNAKLNNIKTIKNNVKLRIIENEKSISSIPDFITKQKPELKKTLSSYLKNSKEQNKRAKENMDEFTQTNAARIFDKEKRIKNAQISINEIEKMIVNKTKNENKKVIALSKSEEKLKSLESKYKDAFSQKKSFVLSQEKIVVIEKSNGGEEKSYDDYLKILIDDCFKRTLLDT